MVQADGCSENRLAHLQNLHPADDLPAFSPCPWGQASKESFSSRKNVLLLDVEPDSGTARTPKPRTLRRLCVPQSEYTKNKMASCELL